MLCFKFLYKREGMEEEQIEDAFENLEQLKEDYLDVMPYNPSDQAYTLHSDY